MIFIPYQSLLCSKKQYQQASVFSQYDQQSNSINNLLLDLSDSHPFFIDHFERLLENFLSRKIVNNLPLNHNTNKITQAIIAGRSFLQPGLSSSLLNLSHSKMEIHPDFYDLIEIHLESTFQEKVIVNNLLIIKIHSAFRFSFCSLILFTFLLMFDMYIHAWIKMLTWLHWKYEYT